MKQKLLLVDGSSLAFRAFYSILDLNRFKNQNGLHTNALYSFHRMFKTILEQENPTHVLVAWDAGKTTFRTEMYAEYKGGRAKTPSEFKEQMPYFNVLLDAWGIPHYRLNQYEADDIIGTLAHQASKEGFEVVVLSGDKDLIQLATPEITVKITTKGVSELVEYTPAFIKEKYGLTPEQIIDMKGLMGDSSDNYPGVTKVGEKTAIKLLQEYGSVEGIYEHVEEMKKSKLKDNLIQDKELAFLSKTLARIDINSPLEITVADTLRKEENIEELLAFYKEMSFQSFQKDLLNKKGGQVVQEETIDSPNVKWIDTISEKELQDATTVHFETFENNYHVAPVLAVAFGSEKQVYVTSIESAVQSEAFKKWLADKTIEKTMFDTKAMKVFANRFGLTVAGAKYDVSLLAYLVDANEIVNEIYDVAKRFGITLLKTDEEVYGKGVKIKVPAEKEVFWNHLAAKIYVLATAPKRLLEQLDENEQTQLYWEMELPLSDILARMEIQGIRVDQNRLIEMGQQFEERLKEIEQTIYELAGEEFNINSPKQLGVILFEKMNLPVIKKTKTGYSTAVDVLEKLASQGPIVESILEYRQLAKLNSTYVEGLQTFIDKTGKIHTRFVQNLTQTGRLSSQDPNLQNIPIRTEEGRQVRSAFLPSQPEWKLLSSDYSQIELRVLAHMANDVHMIEAFKNNIDIHTNTAMRVFGIQNPEEVTSSMRRQAKAVNFGIVYGISDYGLSQNLNIPRKQAKEFIDRYLEEFKGVKDYMETIVEEARQKDYVETLFHRRRYLPEIHSSNFNIRSFAERTAMNSPIQGTAADILKVAMIELDREMQERNFQAKLLLQVHDELIFEVPEEEVESLQSLVEEVMENAVSLSVPLKADSNIGNNWYEAK